MLLNPEEYKYTRFKQHRNDGEEYGESGPLYLAEHTDGTKLIVKQMNAMDAANEYLACSLAQLLNIYAPKAWLFSYHKQIKRISFRYSVGIEYLENLMPISKDELISHPHETAQALILNALINQEDGVEIGMHNGKVVTYDFASAFSMDNNLRDGFLKLMKNPSEELQEHLKVRISNYRDYLDSAYEVLLESDIPSDVIDEEYRKIGDAFLKLADQKAFKPILREMGEIYPHAIVEYYRSILVAIEDLFG